jgi:hypothetical protein
VVRIGSIILHEIVMTVGEFAKRACASRLCKGEKLEAAFERARRDLRLLDEAQKK